MKKNEQTNTISIIGFVLSLFDGLIGLILSIVALVQINKSGEKGKGLAIAGVIIGALRIVLTFILLFVIITLSVIDSKKSDFRQINDQCYQERNKVTCTYTVEEYNGWISLD